MVSKKLRASLKLIKFLFLFSFCFNLYGGDIKKDMESLTSIKKPFELRDPFLQQNSKKSEPKHAVESKVSAGIYDNVPKLGNVDASRITIKGVLIGKERRAMVSVEGSPGIFVLKEGQTIGDNKAELRAILPGGIILVEKITNIYGDEEYLETVIPISK